MSYADKNKALFTERAEVIRLIDLLNTNPDSPEVEGMNLRSLKIRLESVNHELVKLNSGLVGDYIKPFTAHSPQLEDDFFAAGLVGLVTAINSYNLEKGASFSHWARRMIQREVLTEVRKLEHPTIGQADFEKRQVILNVQQQLEIKNPDSNVTAEMVAAKASVTVAQAKRVMTPTPILSLDKAADSGDGGSTAEFVESIPNKEESVESRVLNASDSEALYNIASELLTPREMLVLTRRYGLDGEPVQTLASVGVMLGLSRESVRNIQGRAMAKLGAPEVLERLLNEVGLAEDVLHGVN